MVRGRAQMESCAALMAADTPGLPLRACGTGTPVQAVAGKQLASVGVRSASVGGPGEPDQYFPRCPDHGDADTLHDGLGRVHRFGAGG